MNMTRAEDQDPDAPPGSPADRRTTVTDWHVWMLGLLLVVVLIAIGVAFQAGRAAGDANRAAHDADKAAGIAAHAIKAVATVEEMDRLRGRSQAFRLCQRGNVDRAFAHDAVARGSGSRARVVLRRLEATNGLPILNCDPNLDGRGAEPLTRREQRAFVDAWKRGKLSGPRLGVCPGSRVGIIVDPDSCRTRKP